MHKSFIPLPPTQHCTLSPVKAVRASTALEIGTHIPTGERLNNQHRQGGEAGKEKFNILRNPGKNESCCRACAMQGDELGFQWLLYFVLNTVDVIWK